jgi:hypothetical protein
MKAAIWHPLLVLPNLSSCIQHSPVGTCSTDDRGTPLSTPCTEGRPKPSPYPGGNPPIASHHSSFCCHPCPPLHIIDRAADNKGHLAQEYCLGTCGHKVAVTYAVRCRILPCFRYCHLVNLDTNAHVKMQRGADAEQAGPAVAVNKVRHCPTGGGGCPCCRIHDQIHHKIQHVRVVLEEVSGLELENQALHHGIHVHGVIHLHCAIGIPQQEHCAVAGLLQQSPPGLLLLLLACAAERVVYCRCGDVAVRHAHQSVAGLLLEANGSNFACCIACHCGIAVTPRSFWHLLLHQGVVMRCDLGPLPKYLIRPVGVKDRGEICRR